MDEPKQGSDSAAGIAEPGSDARLDAEIDAIFGSNTQPLEQAGASPEEEAPPEPGESQSAEGQGTSGLSEFLGSLSPEEFDRILELRPELAESSAYLKERERRAEQRGRTKAQETFQQLTGRETGYDALIQQAREAEEYLSEAHRELGRLRRRVEEALSDEDYEEARKHLERVGQVLSSEDYQAALNLVRVSERIQGSRQAIADLGPVLSKHRDLLGQLKPEEEQQLLEAMAEDARKGRQTAYALTVDLLVERARQAGLEEGKKLGRKEAESDLKLVEKLEALTKARAEAAPRLGLGSGAPSSPRDLERASLDELFELARQNVQQLKQSA